MKISVCLLGPVDVPWWRDSYRLCWRLVCWISRIFHLLVFGLEVRFQLRNLIRMDLVLRSICIANRPNCLHWIQRIFTVFARLAWYTVSWFGMLIFRSLLVCSVFEFWIVVCVTVWTSFNVVFTSAALGWLCVWQRDEREQKSVWEQLIQPNLQIVKARHSKLSIG